MRKVELRMNEENKYNIIGDVVSGKINKNRAEVKLGLSRRQIDRLVNIYKNKGKSGFIHGNRDKKPKTIISDEVQKQILDIFINKYNCLANVQHLTEILREDHNISVSTTSVHKILKENNLCSVKANKKTKRNIKKQIKLEAKNKKAKTKKEHNKHIKMLEVLDNKNLHPLREKKRYAGELIQMDASSYKWVENEETWHLHLAIDDSTGLVVGAYFDTQETLKGYYEITKQMIVNYGIPSTVYTDRRTIFEYKKQNIDDISKDSFTQYEYACSQLGITIKTTSIPQAKGKIERLHQTFQSRLTIEFIRNDIKKIEQANEFLIYYLQKYNQQYALQLNGTKNVFQKQEDVEKLDSILAVLAHRVVQNGCFIKFKNKKYFPYNSDGEKQLFRGGTKCLVIKTLSGQLLCNINDVLYSMVEFEEFEAYSKEFDYHIPEEKPKKKQYIPPLTHPWRQDSFNRHLAKSKH